MEEQHVAQIGSMRRELEAAQKTVHYTNCKLANYELQLRNAHSSYDQMHTYYENWTAATAHILVRDHEEAMQDLRRKHARTNERNQWLRSTNRILRASLDRALQDK